MKPNEFDDLIRQKFDQNDFAYNPRHWDQLAEKLEGGSKKRNIIIWWWAPVVGMAASVALAFGVSTVLRMSNPVNGNGTQMALNTQDQKSTHQNGAINEQQKAQLAAVPYTPATVQDITIHTDKTAQDNYSNRKPANSKHRHNAEVRNRTALNNKAVRTGREDGDNDGFNINLSHAAGNAVVLNAKTPSVIRKADDEGKKNKVAIVEPMSTFIAADEPEQPKKVRRVSVILSGGYNRGSQNTGYMAGATIRKMINEKVYVEGDVAFASSNNTQTTAYAETHTIAAVTTRTTRTSKESAGTPPAPTSVDVIKQKNISYDLYYAQVTPSIGYNVMKRMSVAVGPDFQRMLVDNRPAPSAVERGTIQVAPVFDVGFIGKTELGITKKVKAAVYYRKGVNNVITPMGKFIDRDYLQFQVKYTILNR